MTPGEPMAAKREMGTQRRLAELRSCWRGGRCGRGASGLLALEEGVGELGELASLASPQGRSCRRRLGCRRGRGGRRRSMPAPATPRASVRAMMRQGLAAGS